MRVAVLVALAPVFLEGGRDRVAGFLAAGGRALVPGGHGGDVDRVFGRQVGQRLGRDIDLLERRRDGGRVVGGGVEDGQGIGLAGRRGLGRFGGLGSLGGLGGAVGPLLVVLLVAFLGALGGEQRLTVGDRDLIIVGMDFAERQEAVAVAAILDEGGLKRRLDARHFCKENVALKGLS